MELSQASEINERFTIKHPELSHVIISRNKYTKHKMFHHRAVGLALNQHPAYGPLIQDNPGEPVLSQRRDLAYWNNHSIFMSRMSFLPLTL